jgi:hypothetical protein
MKDVFPTEHVPPFYCHKRVGKSVVKYRQKSKNSRKGAKTAVDTPQGNTRATVSTLPAQMEDETNHFHFVGCSDVQMLGRGKPL